ncbi:uncharacterized protein Dwil_GK11408 [Drosophila willistoni]|uniref:Lipocalin/cytosolic fatty-acid binding domain-containing protein n=1 Tax=Drosophila willistoni TaxID=7260 RepID=B4NA87_DROWI|nr:uncharacterized protein LOC6647365 [Drosophila willistoni]EDW80730.1 uncharacterized protein Dwil_GK11408 [Drosophila willistoni]
MMCKVILITAILAIFNGQFATADLLTCQNATSLDFNNTQLAGTWFEVARNPAPSVTCVEITASLYTNATNASTTTYFGLDILQSSSNVSTYQDNELIANFTLDVNGTQGYNVTLLKNGVAQTPYFVKILDLNATSGFLYGCSYTNATAGATEGVGFILSKATSINSTLLSEGNNNASLSYSVFQNGSFYNVTQTGCYRSSASQALPVISGLFALIMLLINRN